VIAIHTLLADLPPDFAPRKFSLGSGSKELIIVIGAAVFVSGLTLIWALFIRKKPRHHHHHHHSHSHPSSSSTSANSTAKPESSQPDTDEGSRRRRRRRRRKEPPRNPTLAETGGLPPIRSEEPPEPHR